MKLVILALAAACASARLAPRQRAQMHVGRGVAGMGMAAVAFFAKGASAEPPRPPGEEIFGTKVVFEAGSGNSASGPIVYMTSHGSGGLVARFVQHIADFFDLDWEGAVHKCRWDFGVRMCAAMHCQQSFKTHHCIDWMGSDRLFSTSGDKFTDRSIILTGVDENIALGELMPSWKHSTGKVMIETYKDMHLIGSDPSLPAPYSYGEFNDWVGANNQGSPRVGTLGLFAAGLCLTDPNCIEAARKFAEEYDWGDIVIPSCMYGAYAVDFLLSGLWRDQMIRDRDMYSRATAEHKLKFDKNVEEFCAGATRFVQKYAEGGGVKMAVQFMDNTAKRTLSPLLLLGEAFEGMLEMTHVGPFEERPIGVGNDDLGKLYGTAHYLFGCIGYKLANEGVGEWDDSYFENITIPVGWHHAHMLSLLLAVIALLAKLKERSKWEEVHWLSLWLGMAFRVVLYGPEHMFPAEGLLEAHRIRVDVFSDGTGNRIWVLTPYLDTVTIARAWLLPPRSVAAIEANGLDLTVRAVEFRQEHPYEHADDGGRPGFVFREKIRDEAGVRRPDRQDQW